MMKRKNKIIVDERQEKIATKSLAWAGFVAYFYTIIIMLFKLIKTKDSSNIIFEVILLLIMTLTIFINNLINKDYDVPSNIKNKRLLTGNSKDDKKARLLYYMRTSIVFPLIYMVIYTSWRGKDKFPIIIESSNILTFIINYILAYIIIFIAEILWHEWNVKRYNNHIKSLEEDDI